MGAAAILIALSLLTPGILSTSAAGVLGPKNYEDCILENMNGVTSNTAARAIMMACRTKFPEKKTPPPSSRKIPKPLPLEKILPTKISTSHIQNVNLVGIERRKYGDSVEFTIYNRNKFAVSTIRVGADTESGKCSWEARDYPMVVVLKEEQYGIPFAGVDANNTKKFVAEIPRKFKYFCIISAAGISRGGWNTLQEFREFHPYLDHLSDYTIVTAIHKNFFPDVPFDHFAKVFEYKP